MRRLSFLQFVSKFTKRYRRVTPSFPPKSAVGRQHAQSLSAFPSILRPLLPSPSLFSFSFLLLSVLSIICPAIILFRLLIALSTSSTSNIGIFLVLLASSKQYASSRLCVRLMSSTVSSESSHNAWMRAGVQRLGLKCWRKDGGIAEEAWVGCRDQFVRILERRAVVVEVAGWIMKQMPVRWCGHYGCSHL